VTGTEGRTATAVIWGASAAGAWIRLATSGDPPGEAEGLGRGTGSDRPHRPIGLALEFLVFVSALAFAGAEKTLDA
jgi:hypothetical protein